MSVVQDAADAGGGLKNVSGALTRSADAGSPPEGGGGR
jgi:hypothetical protein